MIVERPEEVVRHIGGRTAILRLSESLTAFGERCGQAGAMRDLGYFLSKPGALPRTPHLRLIAPRGASAHLPEALLGAVLIFEQKMAGIGLGAYATNDRSGRGNLIARAGDRGAVAGLAAQWLMRRGAHLVLMSYQAEEGDRTGASLAEPLSELRSRRGISWAWREREIPAYLPLPDTLEEALAGLGKRTRRNLRYYRRRVEAELCAAFVPEVEVSREQLRRSIADACSLWRPKWPPGATMHSKSWASRSSWA